ncbi:CDP-alcohol phosphatidyltransferase family protein [bacterium]|nr:CDP-alcohol phosphatidyltransferase family protein [bacterium]
MAENSRRELATRQKTWAKKLAEFLTKANISPNMISIFSMVFALLSALAFMQLKSSQEWFWPLLGVVGIQLRLLCNLMDGLVAIEGGKKTPTGDLYNEIPDRFADVLIILGVGYGLTQAFAVELAWFAALAAVMTAYIRCLGASLLNKHDFVGPFAKQHRMALISFAGIIVSIERAYENYQSQALYYVLWFVGVGAMITFARRALRIANELKAKA